MPTVFPARFAWYLLAAAAAGLVLYLVAPIFTPFLLSAVLAYICLPPVDWLASRMARWLAAAIVMALLVVGLTALALLVLPMVETLLVFGKLFGFFGVLLALPASAALLVALRHLRAHYVDSNLYKS